MFEVVTSARGYLETVTDQVVLVGLDGQRLAAIVEHHGVVGTDEAEGKQLHEKGGHLKGGPQ